MIKNNTIVEKVKEETKDDLVMQQFIMEILNHETESSQFKNKYSSLIKDAVEEDLE